LVATPLAIPDTPWILDYINGSSKTTPSGMKIIKLLKIIL